MLESLDRNTILQRLEPLCATWSDTVIPENIDPLPHFRYHPEYAWMFSFEKDLKNRIEGQLGRSFKRWEKMIFGSDGVLSEGLSNAFVHGNRRQGSVPIEVETHASNKGIGFSITDQGQGFDISTTLEKARQGKKNYFHYAGNGLKSLITCPDLFFSYAEGGRRLFLLIIFS